MADVATISDNRIRRRGNDWGAGLSPAIERARASREPKKPQPPVAATKPAPEEVPTLAALPSGTIYRLILDLEALQDGFSDRIEELGFSLTEIDAAVGLTRGNAQKLLSKSDAKWAREFGWKSLGKMLKGTGLALALIVDDERFSSVKAQMSQRRWKRRQPKLLAPPSSPA